MLLMRTVLRIHNNLLRMRLYSYVTHLLRIRMCDICTLTNHVAQLSGPPKEGGMRNLTIIDVRTMKSFGKNCVLSTRVRFCAIKTGLRD